MKKVRAFLLFFTVACLVFAGFVDAGASDVEAKKKNEMLTSGIHGRILLGPLNPVSRPGQKDYRPYQATVIVKTEDGSQEVATFTSNKHGRFSERLEPGTYLLDPTPGGTPCPTASQQTITVDSNGYTKVTIMYDTGIR